MGDNGQTFEALVDPTRRSILRFLSDREEASAGEIAEAISDVSRTAVSNHLRILRVSGLVSEERRGRNRMYSLDPGPTVEILRFLADLHQSSLSELEQVAAETIDLDERDQWAQSS